MKGILYKLVNYPYLIALKERFGYNMVYENYEFVTIVMKHLSPLEILDFENEIVVEKSEDSSSYRLLKNDLNFSDHNLLIENKDLKFVVETGNFSNFYRSRQFTTLIIAIEIENVEKTEDIQSKFMKLLTEFIQTYRVITGDIYTKLPDDLGHDVLITKEALIRYEEEDLELSLMERLAKPRQIDFKLKSMSLPKVLESYSISDWNIEKNTEKLKGFFDGGNRISQIDEFYIKAKEEFFVNKNYKYGILELFTMIEVIVFKTLTDIKLKRGVSKKKLEDFKKSITISYMLNVELPMFIDNISTEDRKTIGQIDKIRRIRNSIVHENKIVTKEEGEFAFEAINKFIDIIDNKLCA